MLCFCLTINSGAEPGVLLYGLLSPVAFFFPCLSQIDIPSLLFLKPSSPGIPALRLRCIRRVGCQVVRVLEVCPINVVAGIFYGYELQKTCEVARLH